MVSKNRQRRILGIILVTAFLIVCVPMVILVQQSVIPEEDIVLMAKVVDLEAGNCSNRTKALVAQTIVDRYQSSDYPDTIPGVLSQKGQFTTYKMAKNMPDEAVDDDTLELCMKIARGNRYSPYPLLAFSTLRMEGHSGWKFAERSGPLNFYTIQETDIH